MILYQIRRKINFKVYILIYFINRTFLFGYMMLINYVFYGVIRMQCNFMIMDVEFNLYIYLLERTMCFALEIKFLYIHILIL